MCIAVKYGIWNVGQPESAAVNALVGSGYAPLTAMVLSARGINTARQANEYLCCDCELLDPFLMTDMDRAADRVRLAMERGEKIAVFGDYDVDGITATCLLTAFLRRNGANVIGYIPGRLEEGYGLNPIAIDQLHREGVNLIITVDCGITAVDEAQMCKELGIDLVIPTVPTVVILTRIFPASVLPLSWRPPSAVTSWQFSTNMPTWFVWALWQT